MHLAELLDRTGLDVLAHLDRQVDVPVIDGLQAQGDLIVVPEAMADGVRGRAGWHPLPAEGAELVRGGDGTNPHTLVGSCQLTVQVADPEWLAVAMLHNTVPVYLVHPEHGATGIAPGRWVVRRQREAGAFRKAGALWYEGGSVLVAD
ncbi:hypothetical protein SAMN05421837_103664 [Amycolatopsis pretoriensis]|uniref:Uncharacterized protein n=1 Tax=Amycolatopsis pretoriensis TaxID=218821 RepID=A0A1H5QM59_9PSEU|nr:hypothetical protein [Amycolatopsis pretoriensis]SEF27166.1 hypothetical protein SAMN05421837_103664 [Amycolatopsis pretoriensis]